MLDLKVVTDKGSFTTRCLAVDFIAFEEYFDKPVTALEQGRITHLYWLAWTASTREGKVGEPDFKAWAATVTSIEQVDGDDSIPPLESRQSTGS